MILRGLKVNKEKIGKNCRYIRRQGEGGSERVNEMESMEEWGEREREREGSSS